MACCQYKRNSAQGGNNWLEPTGSLPEMDRCVRWIAVGVELRSEWNCGQRHKTIDGSSPEMDHGTKWIVTRYGWMTAGGRQQMDHRRWIMGDRWQSISNPIWCYQATIESRLADILCSGGMALRSTIPSTTQNTISRYWIMHLHAQVTMPNMMSNQFLSQSAAMPIVYIMTLHEICRQWCNNLSRGGWQCRIRNNPYCKQLPYLQFRNNVLWNTFTDRECYQWQVDREKKQQLYCENGEKCMQGSDGKNFYIWIKKPHVQVTIPDEIETQSWQFRHTQLLLNINFKNKPNQWIWYPKKLYEMGQRQSSNLQQRDVCTGHTARKHLGVHFPAENRSWRLLNECTLEDITSRVNKRMWRRVY